MSRCVRCGNSHISDTLEGFGATVPTYVALCPWCASAFVTFLRPTNPINDDVDEVDEPDDDLPVDARREARSLSVA